MINDRFYTKAMAKIYTDQGHFEKAAEIYRYLLEKNPEDEEFALSLAEVEKKMVEQEKINQNDLPKLFEKWIEVLFKYSSIKKIEKLKDYLAKF
ncbi:MAG: hypothetical protein HQK78_04395 [Desulfobacterales bacterium]|nr:hypothetical protein [Desulfobacterales bacterium]